MNKTIKKLFTSTIENISQYLKTLLVLRRLKWRVTVIQNVTKENKTHKVEVKWTKK